MAFASANLTFEPRAFSIGPIKIQIKTFTAVSGDTAGTATFDSLSSVSHAVVINGLNLTAAPTYSGNGVTLAFTDPAANRFGTIIAFGR